MSLTNAGYSSSFALPLAVTIGLLGCSSGADNAGAGGSLSVASGGRTGGGTSANAIGTGGTSTSFVTTRASDAIGGVSASGGTATRGSSGATGGTPGAGRTSVTGGASSIETKTPSGGTSSQSSTPQASGGGAHSGGAGLGNGSGSGGMVGVGGTTVAEQTGTSASFRLTSTELADGGIIPIDATCESSFPSSQLPPLAWVGAPAGTKSYAMVFVDVTLTGMTPPNANGFHSAMWDIPATASSLPRGLPAGSPPAGIAGLETVKQKKAPSGQAWLGPCPNFPSPTRTKTDTYQFRLYALDVESLPSSTSSMTIQQIYNYLEALPPLGVAILSGTSNAAATQLK